MYLCYILAPKTLSVRDSYVEACNVHAVCGVRVRFSDRILMESVFGHFSTPGASPAASGVPGGSQMTADGAAEGQGPLSRQYAATVYMA